MRKYIYAVLSLVMLMAVSCTGDDIEVIKIDPYYNASVSVNTSKAYEGYGLQDFKTYLGSNSNSQVAVWLFLYDSEGNLLDKKSEYTKTFQAINVDYSNYIKGTYTLSRLLFRELPPVHGA